MTYGEIAEGIRRVTRPVMRRIGFPIARFVVIRLVVGGQGIEPSLATVRIEPTASNKRASSLDAILQRKIGDDIEHDAQACRSLFSASSASQFSYLDVMRGVVSAVDIGALLELLRVVRKALA